MIRISTDKNAIGPWVFQKIGKFWHPDGRECVGLLDDGKPLAGTVIENYTGVSCEMHIALAHAHVPLRKFIVAGFHYVFVDLGCEQAIGTVKSTNLKALNFDLKLGFEAVAILPRIYKDADMVILRMERKNCRWIPAELREAA